MNAESTKKKVSISIDSEVWEDAGKKIPNRSEFIEKILKYYLDNVCMDEQLIIKNIGKLNAELSVLETRLLNIRKNRLSKIDEKDIFEAPMVTINRLHEGLGEIGKNQIEKFAKQYDVSYDELLEHIESLDYNIVNYAEPNRNLK
ncbi:MAG: hypothetical protein IJH63_00950 [Methanobrevibacter sp.]|nr:hypothetical protein [Methanosphaera sp.]MBR0369273.1 hypothetical protein [Methanobrevibacter sp.]